MRTFFSSFSFLTPIEYSFDLKKEKEDGRQSGRKRKKSKWKISFPSFLSFLSSANGERERERGQRGGLLGRERKRWTVEK